MSDIAVPRTPTPRSSRIETMDPPSALIDKYHSPPPSRALDMTPPPSTHTQRYTARMGPLQPSQFAESLLTSPLPTLVDPSLAKSALWSGAPPTPEQARKLPEAQLRELVAELLPALGAARMETAHARLQLNLLSIETAEAAQRAAIEHEMTRREKEVLQADSTLLRNRSAPYLESSSPRGQTQRYLELALKRGRQLEAENVALQRKLKQAKRLIKRYDGKNLQLLEDSQLLRQRIKQNRDHLNAMRASEALTFGNTPRPNDRGPPQRPKPAYVEGARSGGQTPFDALLFAGQVLSGEANSVPSTPTHSRPAKLLHGHTRGTHSLSSLPLTPERSRPLTADAILSTPTNQTISTSYGSFSAPATQNVARETEDRRREDRDSTISASDPEEAYTDDDVTPSQASQAATSMLRRYSGPHPDSDIHTVEDRPETKLVQTKLRGRVMKGYADHKKLKDVASVAEEDLRASKRTKLDYGAKEHLGLGIVGWPSPRQFDA